MSKIALFAGHGGADPGAVYGKLLEKDFTLAVMLVATQELRKAGHDVFNNRVTDVNSTLDSRVAYANNNDVDAVIEIHLNANVGTPGTGVEVYHGITDAKSKELARAIHDKIVGLGFKGRGLKTTKLATGEDGFGIIRRTKAPAVLVETAFINNPSDMSMYAIDKMAKAIAQGILEVFPAPVQASAPLYRVFEQVGSYEVLENALAHRNSLKNRSILTVE